jgi:hypothetical protein
LLLIDNLVQKTRVERVIRALAQTGDAQFVDIERIRPRSSAVAASVKVTTSSSSTLGREKAAFPKPEQQAQIKRGNGEGFSRSR